MLKDSDPTMGKIVEESASLIDGSYYISQTRSRTEKYNKFLSCYLSDTTYVPLRHDISDERLDEVKKTIESNSLKGYSINMVNIRNYRTE